MQLFRHLCHDWSAARAHQMIKDEAADPGVNRGFLCLALSAHTTVPPGRSQDKILSRFLYTFTRRCRAVSYFSAFVINAPTSFFSSPKEESWIYIMCPAP